MRHPRTGLIVEGETVMDGEEVVHRVFLANDRREPLPIFLGLGAEEVIFVGKGPPHIGEGVQLLTTYLV